VNNDYEFEVEEFELPDAFESDEELGRFRPMPARRFSPRPMPARSFSRRPLAGPRTRPRPRPPFGRRSYLYAPESPVATEYVRWVQIMLNQALNLQLPIDGVMNVPTRSAIRSFQEQKGLPVTGIVGPDTEAALRAPVNGRSLSSGAAAPPGEPPAAPDEPAPSTSAEPASTSPAAEFEFSWEAMMDEFAPDLEAETSACPPFTPVAVENPGGGRLKDKTIPAGSNLVVIQGAFARTPLHNLAADALKALVCAARADGIRHPLLLPTGSRSGFRDPKMQKAAWERALVKYKTEAEARKWVARPVFSPHQTGRAVDLYLGVPNDSANVAKLRRTPAYKWMVAHAQRFGFYPYAREPWHWEYNPPASGASEVAFAWEGESEWEGESALDVLSPTELKAVKITSTFETGRPGGFGGLTGNFDGQGLSFGLMNFAFKAGSLPPLLQEFITKHPDRYAAAFGKDAGRFKEIVFATKPDPSNPKRRVRDVERQMAFVNTQMNLYPAKAKGNKIVEPWKTYFGRLENDPKFRKIQVAAVRRALDRARYWSNYFELRTERGFAFMFDLVSSHGGAWLNAPKFKGRRRALLRKMLAAKKAELGRDTLTEREKMEVIANMIADVSLPEWREKARVRKLWFVRGSGKVHGHAWDIRKDFGVTDNVPDFGSAGSQEFQWESSQGSQEFQWGSGQGSQEFEWESGQDNQEFEYEQPDVASAPPLLAAPEKRAGGETFYVKVGLGKGLPAATGIYIPSHLRLNPDVPIVVYLHGHKSAYPGNSVLIKGYWDGARFPFFALREEVAASRKNVIFVAPSLGATSQAGSLVQKGGFDGFMEMVIAAINAHYLQPRGMRPLADVQTIILAAHSGGGSPMLRIAAGTDRYARKIKECWGFDSMYGGVASSWLAWAKSHPSRNFYAYYGPAKGYTNKQGRFVASPRDNAEAIACAAKRQNIANVCMQPSRAREKDKVHAHFWVPKAHLGERLLDRPCSAGDVCPQRKPRGRSELEVASPAGIDWSAISGEAVDVPSNGR
jgi:peptidoglycan hydrolase-like protein with peptidoglycan-binding domain